ncbi:MAG: hypothetical protein ACTS3F_03905 [Phycisphaerales bacterium]
MHTTQHTIADSLAPGLTPTHQPPRTLRSHVIDPRSLARAVTDPALWDQPHPAKNAAVLKARPDRAVIACNITLPTGSNAPTASPPHATSTPIIIKIFAHRALRDALAPPRALREWRALWKLHNARIDAALPYILLRTTSRAGSTIDLLVMQRIEGQDLLNAWASGRLDAPAANTALDRIGHQTAALAAASTPLFNRDHKPSNIILTPDLTPVLIDAAGIRNARFRNPIAMLAKLWIETLGVHTLHPDIPLPSRTQRWRVIRAYCRHALTGWELATPPSRRRQCKAAWRAAQRIIERHPDPIPTDDPLRADHTPIGTPSAASPYPDRA